MAPALRPGTKVQVSKRMRYIARRRAVVVRSRVRLKEGMVAIRVPLMAAERARGSRRPTVWAVFEEMVRVMR